MGARLGVTNKGQALSPRSESSSGAENTRGSSTGCHSPSTGAVAISSHATDETRRKAASIVCGIVGLAGISLMKVLSKAFPAVGMVGAEGATADATAVSNDPTPPVGVPTNGGGKGAPAAGVAVGSTSMVVGVHASRGHSSVGMASIRSSSTITTHGKVSAISTSSHRFWSYATVR